MARPGRRGEPAAFDRQIDAGDRRGERGAQEGHRLRHFPRLDQTPHRRRPFEQRDVALASVDGRLQRRRAREAGRDAIDPHPRRPPFGGQTLRRRHDGGLGRRIGVQRHGAQGGDRGDVDDGAGAPRRHPFAEQGAGEIGPAQVDPHHLVVERHRQIGGPQRRLQYARAIDENGDRPDLRLDARGDARERLVVADVARIGARADLARQRLRARLVAVENDDLRPARGEFAAARLADAARSAGDDGHAFDAHVALPLRSVRASSRWRRTGIPPRRRRSPCRSRS